MAVQWLKRKALPGVALVGVLGLAGCASTIYRHPEFGADCESLGANVDCVRVFYGTNRAVDLGAPLAAEAETDVLAVTNSNANALSLGRADIWLPRLVSEGGVRERGETPMARGEAPQDRAEQEQYVFITRITGAGRERFVSDLSSALDAPGPKSILLFVHGFNVGFEPALIRSAQLAVDLRQGAQFDPGVPVLFSWPSLGRMSLSAYRTDGNQADEAVAHLRAFLDLLTADLEADRINIIAHSMGNRVLTQALEDYAEQYLQRPDRRELEFRIVLAAADVERDLFDLVADRIAGLEANVTIYTSDDDLALGFSRLINQAVRLGETNRNRPYIRPADGYATIDATNVASELFGIGHGYYSDNPFILNDIRCALSDVPADGRALSLARYAGEPSGPEYYVTDPELDPVNDNCALRRQLFPASLVPAARPVPQPVPPPPPPPPPPPAAPVQTCPDQEFALYFAWSRSELSTEAEANIEAALARARHCDIAQVLVVGHADASGPAEANIRLSERRAGAVRSAIIARGVNPSIIAIEARGESEPARPTEDGVAEPLNRRVDVIIRYR